MPVFPNKITLLGSHQVFLQALVLVLSEFDVCFSLYLVC